MESSWLGGQFSTKKARVTCLWRCGACCLRRTVRRHCYTRRGFSGASAVKNLPAVQEPQETWVRSLGQEEHPPEEGMATGFSTLAWRIPWTEESGGLQSKGLQRAGPD